MLTLKQFVKYFISGATAAIVNLSIFYIFTDIFEVWYVLSVVLAFFVAFIVSFFLQKFWTFENKDMLLLKTQASSFFLIALSSLLFNMYAVYLLVEYLNIWHMLAQFIVLSFLSITSFVLYKFVVFK